VSSKLQAHHGIRTTPGVRMLLPCPLLLGAVGQAGGLQESPAQRVSNSYKYWM